MRQSSRPWLAVLAALCAPPMAHAKPILHEFVLAPGARAATARPEPDHLPDFLELRGQSIPRPPEGRAPLPGEQVLSRTEARERAATPPLDRITGAEGRLHYSEVFDPSVVPLKRVNAYDVVQADYSLAVSGGGALVPLAVTPLSPDPERDRFFGSLALRTSPGAPVPIPSVAPTMRFLSVEVLPNVPVSFFKDAADNYWLASPHSGSLRLKMLVDAPSTYFSPRISPTATLADVPPRLRPALPRALLSAAARVLAKLGIPKDASYFRVLEHLVTYFRAFKPGPLHSATGDPYLDVTLSQTGVCRHRALAFVVTAQALGIPARYVTNEAHAFVEVYVPRSGWIRIDLGGAAMRLDVSQGEQKALYTPGPDPFPRSQSRASGPSMAGATEIRGLGSNRVPPRQARAPLRRGTEATHPAKHDALASAERPARASSSTHKSAASDESPSTAAAAAAPMNPRDAPARQTTDNPAAAEQRALKQPVVQLSSENRALFRGELLTVRGRVSVDGSGVPRLRVRILLSADGVSTDAVLGTVDTQADGRFEAQLPVNRDIPAGHYRVYAATDASDTHAAAVSR